MTGGKRRILIAGCGDVGCRLGHRLVAVGHDVWGLRRNPVDLPEGLEPLVADLARPETLTALPPRLDAVVYTAAADRRSDDAYRRAYVDGVENLLTALEGQKPPPGRILFTSSTAVYCQTGGEWVDEDSVTRPSGYSGRRVLEGEERFRRGRIPAVVLRLGGIYGPGRIRLLERVASGEAVCPEGPPVYTNRIHSDDAAGALFHLLELNAPDSVYVGVDHEPADLCQVLRFLARRLGVDPPRSVPGAESERRGGSKRCSSRRLRESGYRFVYPSYREGYEALIRRLAASGG
jgi:nucleoside-diphosphate-sugar epimerase